MPSALPILHIDFETRSPLDLPEVGVHRYARHPDTDVWCMGWAIEQEEPHIWRQKFTPARALSHVISGGIVFAHSASFELEIWNEIMVTRYGWPRLSPEQTFCTMALSHAMGLPGTLEDAALALGCHLLKDIEGRALMLKMARPKSKPGQPLTWQDSAQNLARLYAYCRQDVRVERELHTRLMPLSDYERRIWLMDYAINQRGVKTDMQTTVAAVKMVEGIKDRCNKQLSKITRGAVASATALEAMKEWLETQGVSAPSLAKQNVIDHLNKPLSDDVRSVLMLRQEAGRASTAKLTRIVEMAGADARLRHTNQYHGANTGRWAGRGVQLHNLPREVPPPETVEKILELVRQNNVEAIDAIYGPPMEMISKSIRGFFIPDANKVLIGGDYANVEGRGVAWFSGEQWKLAAFRAADAGHGPGIYELAYAKSFNVPVESIKDPSPERQAGKVQELAFGFGGGVAAARKMLPANLRDTDDITLNEWKLAWRKAHPRTVHTWYDLESAAKAAAENEGKTTVAGFPGREVKFKKVGSFLWCLLPSGRALCYPYPKVLLGDFGSQLTYMTVPSADKTSIIKDVANANNWARCATWGGSLMENVIQALCRDLLADAMLRLHDLGKAIVLHVHDEVVIEAERGEAEAERQTLQTLMRTPPAWAAGFPLWAKCKIMERYGK